MRMISILHAELKIWYVEEPNTRNKLLPYRKWAAYEIYK